MAYLDSGEGQSIVFPYMAIRPLLFYGEISLLLVAGMGRIVVPDLIGMGDSEKLRRSRIIQTINITDNINISQILLDSLDLGNEVNLVIHDWGSAMGFQYATGKF